MLAPGGTKVLIIDGSPRVRARLAERLMERAEVALGVAVVEAADLDAGLSAVGTSPPHVVVIDVHLDANTGVAALRRIRQATPTATVVVLTNEVNDVHRDECMRHGADFFFDKSRDFERLFELVRVVAEQATRRS
jgi:DNA-binding NarL/FixJ family response regulator